MTTHTDHTSSASAQSVPQPRLPGQAAPPEGPVDMTMTYLIHHGFRRDIAAFAAAVPRTPVEDRATWRAMADRWELFAATLHHHHHGEDTWLWPFLRERATTDERAMLEEMEAEHAEIDPVLEAVHAGFTRLRDHADADVQAALAVRLAAARERLRQHLRHEEAGAIALLQRVMTQQEWESVDEHFKKSISFGLLLKVVPWVMHQVPTELQRQVASAAGPAHRLLWRLTRPGFERREARAFRHLEG